MIRVIRLIALFGFCHEGVGGENASQTFRWELPTGTISLQVWQTPTSEQVLGLRNESGSGRVFAGTREVVGARAENRPYPIDLLVTTQIVVRRNGRRYVVNRAELSQYLNLHFGTEQHDWNAGSGRLIAADRQGAALVIPGGGGEHAYSLIVFCRFNRRPLIFFTSDVP